MLIGELYPTVLPSKDDEPSGGDRCGNADGNSKRDPAPVIGGHPAPMMATTQMRQIVAMEVIVTRDVVATGGLTIGLLSIDYSSAISLDFQSDTGKGSPRRNLWSSLCGGRFAKILQALDL